MGACEDESGENGYTHNEAEAIEKGTINGEANNNYIKQQQQQQETKTIASAGSLQSLWKKTIWHGGSVYDAWLNAVAAQVSLSDLQSDLVCLLDDMIEMGYDFFLLVLRNELLQRIKREYF
jgi:hypothetical protein